MPFLLLATVLDLYSMVCGGCWFDNWGGLFAAFQLHCHWIIQIYRDNAWLLLLY